MREAKEYGNQHGSTERSNIRKIKEDHVRAGDATAFGT